MRRTLIVGALLAGGLFAGTSASAMPIAPMPSADNNVEKARLVCNAWGRCWHTRRYGYYGYYRPRRYYGPGWGYYGPRFYGGPAVTFGFGPRYGYW
jgi:hypothetical protein